MHALIVEEWGSSPRLVEMPVPQRAAGHSLVRMLASTVGHLDATIASGNFGLRPELPYIPGVEGAGEVLESDRWPTGSIVVVRGAGVGIASHGTWCEVAHVPDISLAPAPAGMTVSLAACYFVPTTTAYTAVHDICALGPGTSVLVVGSRGAVGGLTVQLARAAGAQVVAMSRGGSVKGETWGADESVVAVGQHADPHPTIGHQVDAIVDMVAGADFASRLRWLAPGGICALVGYTGGTEVTLDAPSLILSDVTITPVNMLRREDRARAIAPDLAARLVSGDLLLRVAEYAPSDAVRALADVTSGAIHGRAVLRFA